MPVLFVEMSEEEVARRWASANGICLIGWGVIHRLVEVAPRNMVLFDSAKSTYRLIEDSSDAGR